MAMINVAGKYYFSKWNLGDTVGRLTIVAEPVHRNAKSGRGDRQWYYVCRCSCGSFPVEKSQEALMRNKVMCTPCANAARESVKREGWIIPKELPEGVPNFATLPAPESVGGPEDY